MRSQEDWEQEMEMWEEYCKTMSPKQAIIYDLALNITQPPEDPDEEQLKASRFNRIEYFTKFMTAQDLIDIEDAVRLLFENELFSRFGAALKGHRGLINFLEKYRPSGQARANTSVCVKELI